MKITSMIAVAIASMCVSASAMAGTIAYSTGGYNPWYNTTNDTAMNTTFGAGKWVKSNGFSTNVFANADFVFLDGSDGNANEFNSFLSANRTAIATYVDNGGRLFLNAAPNQGGSIDLGFGVTLQYPGFSGQVNVTAAGVAAGLTTGGIASSYQGGSFGHATVSGGGISDLIESQQGGIVFGAMQYGKGFVAFGGQTTTNFHSPNNDAQRLLVNELQYVASAETQGSADVPEPASLALLGLGALAIVAARRKSAAK